ncbi:MAG TPA: D-Ala-D-Ala carboxypeptidase family metallohydrolase [Gemmatimonadaceae bacterium]|nr:D-Ala-D-Ala carboxypeptidase family metallohydrolase [Gemmatimonadaceae bacterium]
MTINPERSGYAVRLFFLLGVLSTPALASAQLHRATDSTIPWFASQQSESPLADLDAADGDGLSGFSPAAALSPPVPPVRGMGHSGKIFARFMLPEPKAALPYFSGTNATPSSSSHPAAEAGRDAEVVFTMRSFAQKVRTHLNGYRLGYWPAERGRRRSDTYRNPDGFIEVTRENQDTRISEHFRLRDFLTHDQPNVWPKYIVLREPLLDKLELVIDDLRAHGYNAEGMRVISGFRTPHHNGVRRREGSARDSRHQFGDAADVIIDNNGTGKMADLNGDKRVGSADVKIILASVERVEKKYPELVGGTGLYSSPRSGAFAHIDVRGTRARWVLFRGPHSRRASARRASSKKSAVSGKPSGKTAPKARMVSAKKP